jgi:hypothetical protein
VKSADKSVEGIEIIVAGGKEGRRKRRKGGRREAVNTCEHDHLHISIAEDGEAV